MAHVWIRQGTGFPCRLCGSKITTKQLQINFRAKRIGSAVIHSNPKDCINYRLMKSLNQSYYEGW